MGHDLSNGSSGKNEVPILEVSDGFTPHGAQAKDAAPTDDSLPPIIRSERLLQVPTMHGGT